MNHPRRSLLAAGALGAALPFQTRAATPPAHAGLAVLTVSGAITKRNRGPLDPALDQLLAKHKAAFESAWEFDAAALARLPSVAIEPTLEYDAKPHRLSGPLLSTVVAAAGAAAGGALMLSLRALDGYTVNVSLADANTYRMIVATRIDGAPMGVGGLGPQWAVYDADRVAAFKDKPLKDRFGLCPWGLYYIEVKAL